MPDIYPLENRLAGREGWAYLALDNIDAIVEKFVGIMGGPGRQFTKIQQYVHRDGSRSDLWNLSYEAKRSLHVDHAGEDYRESGVRIWKQREPVGKGVHFNCSPGIEGFGISVHQEHAIFSDCPEEGIRTLGYITDTEQQVYDYANGRDEGDVFKRTENITLVRWHGTPGEPHHSDRLFIQDWNQHGVLSETVVMFEAGTYVKEPDYWKPEQVPVGSTVRLGHPSNNRLAVVVDPDVWIDIDTIAGLNPRVVDYDDKHKGRWSVLYVPTTEEN